MWVRSALKDEETEQRRDGVYGYPGEHFELEGEQFEITSLTHDRLGDMGEAEARKEGFEGLDAYKSLIIRMHKGMEWDTNPSEATAAAQADSSCKASLRKNALLSEMV
jgi:hypothetical protein